MFAQGSELAAHAGGLVVASHNQSILLDPPQPQGSIARVDWSGGAISLLATEQNYPFRLAAGAGHVVWQVQHWFLDDETIAETPTIAAAPIDGGSPMAIAVGEGPFVLLGADDGAAFFHSGRRICCRTF
jgi:hypothetical protein